MRQSSKKLTKPDAPNHDLVTPFRTRVPPFAANMTSFCDLALGTCPWVAQGGICMVFWLNSGSQFVNKCKSVQDRTKLVPNIRNNIQKVVDTKIDHTSETLF